MSDGMKRAWKELLVTLAVVVTMVAAMYLLLGVMKTRKLHAAAQDVVATESAAPPYALHAANLRPAEPSRREEIRVDVAETKSLLGDALVDRYLAPYDAWVDYWNPAMRTAHPLCEKGARWYLLRLRAENVHAGRDIDLRFCLDPAGRINWSCGDPSCPNGEGCDWHRNSDNTWTKETMDGYARRYRERLADVLSRYLLDLLRHDDTPTRRDYRETVVTGAARLYELHSADADASNVRALTEIK